MKILLVDDEKIKRIKMARFLKSKGLKVEEAINGIDAINKLKKAKYDLLVIDHIMPKLTGIDACKIIKNNKMAPQMKIIILLGYGGAEDYPELEILQIDKALSKPIKPEDLISNISQLFIKK
jgi:CheY-like chemotaxis protein